jgi:hypothetical protein
VQRREQPEQHALAAAHQRGSSQCGEQVERQHPPGIDRARVMHGDLEGQMEDHLTGDEHREDLRPSPPAGAQPG